jgi:MinD-like ATPase involved in chromosome partitioning or flagellar assembly
MTKMNGIIRRIDNLDYIQGVTFGPDLYELTMEDMTEWMKGLKNSGQYEVIIFDVGSFSQATLELFCESNKILLVLGENDLEQVKYQNFKSQLLWAGFDDVINKLEVIPLNREVEEKFMNVTAKGLYNSQYMDFAASYVEE